MTDIISRLLDEAEKAQRKGHLVLAEVCRDASDKIGLLEHEAKLMREKLDFPSSDSEPDRTLSSVVSALTEASDEIERLRLALRDIASGRYSNIMLPTHPPQDPAVVRARDALRDSGR